ncbi:P-type DNA transfer protein VirB5 [Aureimonas altamirensis]|uniref:P-type DNA transfer protein VirB5 n=1 Tax=Aureimonas altamirensis TaxID=370622 RepID=UPI0025563FBF|nr:P-type DNA transfer protein VirB5 [Aureimonas altamirensis]
MTRIWSTKLVRKPPGLVARLARIVVLGAAVVGSTATASFAQGIPVIDATAIARWGQQLSEMKAQLDQAKQIYDEAQRLGDSFNQTTDAGDIASLLNNREFQQYLPQEYSRTASAVDSLLQGNVDGFAREYDYYEREGATPANDFYYQELQRRKSETYQDMAVGEVVYNQASERLDGLNELRDRIGTAGTPKEIMDLQARIQAESAVLQNEVLRMQGLAMIQEARGRVDEQREAEEKQRMHDQIRAAVSGG